MRTPVRMSPEQRAAITLSCAAHPVGEQLVHYFETHRFLVMRTKETGIHTGRPRFLVACLTCEGLVHEATTGPAENMEMHVNHVNEARDKEAPLPEFLCAQCSERCTYDPKTPPERCGRCGADRPRIGVDQDLTITGSWLDVRDGCAVVLLKVDGAWQEVIRTPIANLITMQVPHRMVIKDPDFPLKMRIACSCGFTPPPGRDPDDAIVEHLVLYRPANAR